MATLTVVITYTGTEPAEEVTSFTSGGTAYASIAAADMITTRRLMLKACKAVNADYPDNFRTKGC